MNIRNANINDLKVLTAIENVCFPPAEAAKEKDFKDRLEIYPNHFWIIEEDGEIVCFINGLVTDISDLQDEMFENAEMHNENGKWYMILGLNTVPTHRDQGYAGTVMKKLLEECKKQGRKGVVLTCKEHLISYYESFGFKDEGLSASVYGNAVWYQMRYTL